MDSPRDVEPAGANAARRIILLAAAIAGALGVLLGAFGAHGLPDHLSTSYAGVVDDDSLPRLIAKRVGQFDTGARYHLVHAVAMLAVGCWPFRDGLPRIAAWLMLAGILLFSGSLYALVLSNQTWLGAITPLGGLSWIVAWLMVAFAAWKST
ncbi:MAG: DUF423 domain-containing protein [Planctomycetota bacterium]